MEVKIAPSILSADFARLEDEIKRIEDVADWIHVDVMDGHFVPNISIGVPVVRSVSRITDLPIDTHLMISNPMGFLKPFSEAGSDYISVHAEVCKDLSEPIAAIHGLGRKAGVVFNPNTGVKPLWNVIDEVDYVLVMAVMPGFSGQKFMPEVLKKVEEIRNRSDIDIQVDGGININNAKSCVEAGANILVAGNAVFKAEDPRKAVLELKECAE
ncbi:MAG: ribulose-phosphate 3-epimerase [archaeon]